MAGEMTGVDETLGLRDGVADSNDASPAYRRECADVKKWLADINQARKFDEEARKQYAMNRRTARGDRGSYEVSVPICQSYIDVMNSFLYAKNPQVSCSPSGMTDPPPAKDIEALILDQQQQAQPMPGIMDNAAPMAMAGSMGAAPPMMPPQMPPQGAGGPPPGMAGAGSPPPGVLQGILSKFAPGLAAKLGAGGPAGPMPPQGPPGPPPPTPEEQLQTEVSNMLRPYQKKRTNAKQLSSTMELVISDLWKKGKLKERAKMQVKSALTVGPGVLKAFWMERMGNDPVVQGQIDDLLEQMARMKATQQDIDDPQSPGLADDDAKLAELEQQHAGLMAKVEVMVARGFAIEFVAAEDFQVSMDVPTLAQYADAAWIGNRTFKTLDQAKADFPDVAKKLARLAVWKPRKPRDTSTMDVAYFSANDVTANEADAYTKGNEDGDNATTTAGDGCVCIWEIWDRQTSNVLTLIEGLECYAKKPYVPEVSSTRGHPYFLYTIGNVDGQRHPRSLPTRSERLFDEYNARRSASAKHRRRCLPKMGYDATNYDADEIAKLEAGDIGEMIGLKSIDPAKPIAQCLVPIAYNNYDAALYDTHEIRGELETIWGIQEADSQGIQTAKTATEAGIQEQGKQSRTGFMTSDLDDMLNDLAQYTGEVSIQKMTPEDVQDVAGPWALWPQGMKIEDLGEMVSINIQAGSSGKPSTAMEQQAWATILPVLQNAVQTIGQLRGSDHAEVADCMESLVQETVNRTGDHIDASQFIPDAPRTPPPPPMGPPPQPLMDSALTGPQTLAMLGILADVKALVLSPDAGKGALMASYPHLPPELVDKMVHGSLPLPGDPATQLIAPHAETVPPPAPLPVPGTSATTGAPA